MKDLLERAAGRLGNRRDQVQVAIILNQLATPGLGSWLAGHRIAGAGQLVLACGGFVLFVVYFALWVVEAWRARELMLDVTVAFPPAAWWHWAFILFGIAWLWSLITSVQLWRELRRQKDQADAILPPRLG
jgi:hypothetical protein